MKKEKLKEELVYLRRKLLNNHFIHKKKDPKLFNDISRNKNALTKFFNDKMNFRLEVGHDFAKLEKFPDLSSHKSWMTLRINDKDTVFDNKSQFIMLCLTLAFLDKKGTKKQFLLNDLIEFLETNYKQLLKEKLTFEEVGIGTINRNALVQIIKYLGSHGFIEIVDEQFDKGEALLKVLKNYNYFLHSVFSDIGNVETLEELIEQSPMQDFYFNPPAGTKLIRRIAFSSTIEMDELDEDELHYVQNKKHRNYLFNFFQDELGCLIEFYDSLIVKISPTHDAFDTFLGRENSEEKLLLFLMDKIAEEDIQFLSIDSLGLLVKEIIKENKGYFSAALRDKNEKKLSELVLSQIVEWGVGNVDEGSVRFNLMHKRFLRNKENKENQQNKEEGILV